MPDRTEQSNKDHQKKTSGSHLKSQLSDQTGDKDTHKEKAQLRVLFLDAGATTTTKRRSRRKEQEDECDAGAGGCRRGAAPTTVSTLQSLSPSPPSTFFPPESSSHPEQRPVLWTSERNKKKIDIVECEPNRVFPPRSTTTTSWWDHGEKKPEAPRPRRPSCLNTFIDIFGAGASSTSPSRELAAQRFYPRRKDNKYTTSSSTSRTPANEDTAAPQQGELAHSDELGLALLHRLSKQLAESSEEEEQEERSELDASHPHVLLKEDKAPWSSTRSIMLRSDFLFSAHKSDKETSSASESNGGENQSAVHGITTTDSDETPGTGMAVGSCCSSTTSGKNQRIRQSDGQDDSYRADASSADSSEEQYNGAPAAHRQEAKEETRRTTSKEETIRAKKQGPPGAARPPRQRLYHPHIGSNKRRRGGGREDRRATTTKKDNIKKNNQSRGGGKRMRRDYPKSKTGDTPSSPSSPATCSSCSDVSSSDSNSKNAADRRKLLSKKERVDPSDKFNMARLRYFMKESEKTQASLQEWDTKNGLPKSHSQTMVNTSRSRRQLQEDIILSKWDGTPLINDETELGKPRPRRRKTVPMASRNVTKGVGDSEELLVQKKSMHDYRLQP